MIIQESNDLTVEAPKTYLANSITAGTNVLPMRNLLGFNSNWAVQIGETGEQTTEIIVLSGNAPSGTLGTLVANTVYDHPADTPVYGIKWDQVVFSRSTTGTAGTAVPLNGGTQFIQANSPYTSFDDTAGSISYAYQTYFQNSVLLTSSLPSDWIVPGGFSFYSLGKMRQRVKDKLISDAYLTGNAGVNLDDTVINDWLNEWMEYMTNIAIDVNEDYQMGTMQISYGVGVELGTIVNTDFKQLRRVWYTDATGTYQATKMDSNSYSPNKTFTDTYPYFYMQGDSVIGRQPIDQAGTHIIEYYKLSPVMVEDTDQLPVNMQGYTRSFISYAHSQALFKDAKIQEATIKLQEAEAAAQRFKAEITPRHKTGPTFMDIVEDTAADQELWL